ncbi:hypothetical protein TD95_005411 [Thielaviopsis punctulata]|uniref:Thioredoxin domain-containing protein n=1 Tax=Thielaviopsis punctulata TaxID=72032 RepID=A0A0F4ZDL7_9PEZI|nr:hypothetical protein TD95_005411 [Thielaviopsis punctulata]
MTASDKASQVSSTAPIVDTSKPKDFDGALATTDDLPPNDVMRKIGDLQLLDKNGNPHAFEKIVSGAERTLVIFVRHFFCGNCQEYIRGLSAEIQPEALPVNSAIVIIGCGDPQLINMYVDATGCKYPLYTDPERKVFDRLGMIKTLQLGKKPKYMKQSMTAMVMSSIAQGLRQIPTGLAHRSGDHRQVGGEFMFETAAEGVKQVTWCHRMRTTRDHAEVDEIKRVLHMQTETEEAI